MWTTGRAGGGARRALADARAMLSNLVESAETGQSAWPMLAQGAALDGIGQQQQQQGPPRGTPRRQRFPQKATAAAAALQFTAAKAGEVQARWPKATAAAYALAVDQPPQTAGAGQQKRPVSDGGSEAAQRAVAALQQAAEAGRHGEVGAAAAEEVASAARLLVGCLDALPSTAAAAALHSAAVLVDSHALLPAKSAGAQSAAPAAASEAVADLLGAAADFWLPRLSARELASVAAAWPADWWERGTGPTSKNSSSSSSSSSSPGLSALLEGALRAQQLPGTWDAAAVADLAVALFHAVPSPSGSAFLSLAMLSVEVAERQRRAQAAPAGTRRANAASGGSSTADLQPAFTPGQLLAVSGAFTGRGHYNRAAFDVVCSEAITCLRASGLKLDTEDTAAAGTGGSKDAAGAFTPSQLTALVGDCAQARHFDGRLLQVAADALSRCRHNVALEALVQAVDALATLNVNDAALFAKASAAAQQWMQGAIAAAEAASPKPPVSLSGTVAQQQQQQQQQQDSGQQGAAEAVVRLACAFAVAQHVDGAFFDLLCRWLAAAPPHLSEDQLAGLFEVQSALTDAAAGGGGAARGLLSLSLPPALLVGARAAWSARRRAARAAAFQSEVHAALHALGLPSQLSVPTPCGLHVVDAVVRAPGTGRGMRGGGGGVLRLALSLDGPEAFAANAPSAPLGATAARWRALQARGMRVVSVRWSDWARLAGDAVAQREYLWETLLAAADAGPAAAGVFVASSHAGQGVQAAVPAAGDPVRSAARWWRRILDGGGG